MEMSPQQVRTMSFSTAKKGYDSAEVSAFVHEVATALEAAQNETTAMEARARAAVARLQELSQAGISDSDSGSDSGERSQIKASVDETETISRTLLLAQRTADTTVADANAQAEQILGAARDDAAQSLDQARTLADRLIEDAKDDARKAGEGERLRVGSEVQELSARRDFLESDVDHLESFLDEQRQRIRESATTLADLADRVAGGLGAVHRPLLSAAGAATVGSSDGLDDDDDTQPHEMFVTDDGDADEIDDTFLDDLEEDADEADLDDGEAGVGADTDSTPAGTSPARDSLFPETRP